MQSSTCPISVLPVWTKTFNKKLIVEGVAESWVAAEMSWVEVKMSWVQVDGAG